MNTSYGSIPLQYWTGDHVAQWLRDKGFSESVVMDFQRNYVTGPRLVLLSLVDIAPPLFNGDFETRNRLMGELSLLQTQSNPAQGNQPYIPQPYAQQPYVNQPYAQQPFVQQPYVPQSGGHAIQMVPLGNGSQEATMVDYVFINSNFFFSNDSGYCKMTGNNLKRTIIAVVILDALLITVCATVGAQTLSYALPAVIIAIVMSFIGPIRVYRRIMTTADYQFNPSQIIVTWKKKPPVTIPAQDVQSIHRGHKVYYSDGDEINHYTIRIILKSLSAHREKFLELPITFTEEKPASDATYLLAKLYRVEMVMERS